MAFSLYRFYTTPSNVELLIRPRFRAAAMLMPMILRSQPANLKNAILEIDLSSKGDLEFAKMDLRTAGVTGIPPFSGSEPAFEGWWKAL